MEMRLEARWEEICKEKEACTGISDEWNQHTGPRNTQLWGMGKPWIEQGMRWIEICSFASECGAEDRTKQGGRSVRRVGTVKDRRLGNSEYKVNGKINLDGFTCPN